jgi:hypothetical protein
MMEVYEILKSHPEQRYCLMVFGDLPSVYYADRELAKVPGFHPDEICTDDPEGPVMGGSILTRPNAEADIRAALRGVDVRLDWWPTPQPFIAIDEWRLIPDQTTVKAAR